MKLERPGAKDLARRCGLLLGAGVVLTLALVTCSNDRKPAPQGGADGSEAEAESEGEDAGGEGEGEGGGEPDGGHVQQDLGGGPDRDQGVAGDLGERPDNGLSPRCAQPPPDRLPNNISISHQCSAQAGQLKIYDLRDRYCPHRPANVPTGPPGVAVSLRNVVVTARFPGLFTVADPGGGTFSAIWIYNKNDQIDVTALQLGTRVNLQGKYMVFFGLDEVSLDSFTVVSQGEPLEPLLVHDPADLITDAPLADPLQGMLLRIEDVRVATTKPDCPNDFGDFTITGRLRIDNMGVPDYIPAPGDAISSVTGVLNYAFGNTKLAPRSPDDLQVVSCGHQPDKCPAQQCIVEENAQESGELVVTEIQYDPKGVDTQGEWFELFNPGDTPVNVRGWAIKSCGNNVMAVPAGAALNVPAHGYKVIGANADRRTNGGIDVLFAYDSGKFYLPNSDGAILLFDGSGVLVDQVRYSSTDPWPPAPSGTSLVLDDPASPNLGPEHWSRSTAAEGSSFCTPGAANR